VVGKELRVDSFGPIGQDWTGPYVGVGPDGFKDVKISLANISASTDGHVTVAAPSIGRAWESGLNPNGRWNAELLNRPGLGVTFGTTADLFFSTDVDLAGVPLKITITYERSNPANPNVPLVHKDLTNREGKTDTVNYTPAGTNHTSLVAMPAVAVSNLPQTRATSLDQDPSYPGYSHVKLDAASLPSGKTLAAVSSAILGDDHGSNWTYGTAPYIGGGASPLAMQYNAATGVFDFPPVRDEAGATLNLLLTFTDGSQAVARFVGKPSDIGRRAADTRVGAAPFDVSSAASLLTALGNSKPNIRLKAGAYTLTQPLTLTFTDGRSFLGAAA
jgi:hypothetical protein